MRCSFSLVTLKQERSFLYKRYYINKPNEEGEEIIRLNHHHQKQNQMEPVCISSKSDLEYIKSHFTQDELMDSNKFIPKILRTFSEKRNLVEMLLHFYYSNYLLCERFDFSILLYLIHFKNEYLFEIGNIVADSSNRLIAFKMCIKYCSINLFNGLFKNNISDIFDCFYLMIRNKKYTSSVFKYCNGNNNQEKEKRLEFVKNGCNQYISNVGTSNPFEFLYLLILYDDISLLEFAITELKNGGLDLFFYNEKLTFQCVKGSIFFFIKSIQMLEYCWSNKYLKCSFTKSDCSMKPWYNFGRIDLLEKFEQLNSSGNKIQNLYSHFIYSDIREIPSDSILKTATYLISKPNVYTIDIPTLYLILFPFTLKSRSNIIYFKIIIQYLSKFDDFNNGFQMCDIINNIYDFNPILVDVLDWLLEYNSSFSRRKLPSVVSITGRFDQIDISSSSECEIKILLTHMVSFNDIELLINYFKNQIVDKFIIKSIISLIFQFGSLELFKYIYKNFNSFINSPFLSEHELIELVLDSSTITDIIVCTDYIINKMNIKITLDHFKIYYKKLNHVV